MKWFYDPSRKALKIDGIGNFLMSHIKERQGFPVKDDVDWGISFAFEEAYLVAPFVKPAGEDYQIVPSFATVLEMIKDGRPAEEVGVLKVAGEQIDKFVYAVDDIEESLIEASLEGILPPEGRRESNNLGGLLTPEEACLILSGVEVYRFSADGVRVELISDADSARELLAESEHWDYRNRWSWAVKESIYRFKPEHEGTGVGALYISLPIVEKRDKVEEMIIYGGERNTLYLVRDKGLELMNNACISYEHARNLEQVLGREIEFLAGRTRGKAVALLQGGVLRLEGEELFVSPATDDEIAKLKEFFTKKTTKDRLSGKNTDYTLER